MSAIATHEIIKERYFPERKIVVVSAELVGRTDYIVGLATFLLDHKAEILSCIVQAHPDRNLVHVTLFLDMTNSDLSPSRLLAQLRRRANVRRIELLDIPLTHGAARLAVFTLEDMHRLFEKLREAGSGGLAIIYHMGYGAGESLAKRLGKYFRDNRKALEYLLLYYETLGHGKFKLRIYSEKERCKVVVEELLECMGVKSSEPNSQLFRGILAGFLTELWGVEVEVVETKCIAMGDEYCEFEARVK